MGGIKSHVALAFALLFSAACGMRSAYLHPAFAPSTPETATYRLLLIGDGGELREPEPVLTVAALLAGRMAGRTTAIYLGDNAYPRGISGSEATKATARLTLARQVDTLSSVARVVVVPGNHDWAKYGRGGIEAIREQADFVRARGARFAPAAGCPGPDAEPLDLPEGHAVVRVIAIDTQWWLHDYERGTNCDPGDRGAFVARLLAQLDTKLPVVIAAHHPLATHGQHGGYLPWQTHVFPLRSIPGMTWAWLPLPGLGSIYPLGRRLIRHEQDVNGPKNIVMRDAISEAVASATTPPLVVFAAGHDHALQVLRGPGVDFTLVSGAGASHHEAAVGRGTDTLLAQPTAGFMVLDVAPGGLSVAVVDPVDATTWDRWYPLRKARP